MSQRIIALPGDADHEWQLNLSQLREGTLNALYLLTYVVGFALVAIAMAFPKVWAAGGLGILFLVIPYPLRTLASASVLARAWVLIVLWFGASIAGAFLWPEALIVLAMVVAFARLLVGMAAGVGVALGASLVVGWFAYSHHIAPQGLSAAIGIWGGLIVLSLGIYPIYAAMRWSWSQYDHVRRQADHVRDAQSELKQAVEELVEKGVQMARLNQLLESERRRAEEAERVKEQFVANVSHELRTPLNMIIGYGEMIMHGSQAYGRISRTLRADLSVILRNSQHLSGLIDDVLDLSQIEAGQMALTKERTLLSETVAAAVEAIRPLFEMKQLYLNTDVPSELELYCDRTRIREVLLNLLSNAGRFTEQGGVVVWAHREESEVVVSISDTGPGIAPEDQSKLFQPFHQVDASIRRRYGGTGLGLAISRQFVQLHGGRMWLESEPGKGTTIHFALPVVTPAPTAMYRRWLSSEWEYHMRTRNSAIPTRPIKPRLVVVEPANTLQRMLLRYLGDIEVTAVSNLDDAGQELLRKPAQALLVSGPSVGDILERVRQSDAVPYGVPVLVCSLPGELEAAQSLGVAGYLVKPISSEALLAALHREHVDQGTILIVDDEPEAVRLFWRMLTAAGRGYRVLTAASGQQALSMLASDRPDAILLDLVMPDMDGFHLLAARDAHCGWRDVPVIVMSARDPAGHPIVTSAVGITRRGGLNVPQLLDCIRMQAEMPDQEPAS